MPQKDSKTLEKHFPICVAPAEQHYGSCAELLGDIRFYERSRAYFYKEHPQFAIPKEKFEIVKLSHGKGFILLPTALDYGVLYRGQGSYFNPCLPTLYRKPTSELDIIINQVRIAEFRLLLEQYGVTQKFIENHLNVDYVGLAQHYGLDTDVLDFTSDIGIALFFAMCDYDPSTDSYKPKDKPGDYVGYVYAILTNARSKRLKDMAFTTFSDKVRAIGLQPFKRPGRQKGFSCHVGKDGLTFGYLYSFNYTMEDSINVYKKYENGNYLWCKDDIARYAKEIKGTKTFSSQAVALSARMFPSNQSIKNRTRLLKANYFSITGYKKLPWANVGIPCTDSEWLELRTNMVQRETFQEGNKRYNYRNTDFIGMEIITNLLYGCTDAPKGYDSGINFLNSEDKIFGLQYDMKHKPLEPDKNDGKIHALWKDSNCVAPNTRSFDFPDYFKMTLQKVKH